MTKGDGWVSAEVLDNPTGEPSTEEYDKLFAETESAIASEEETAEPVEAAAEEESDPRVSEVEREKAGILRELRETRDAMKRERLENAERNRVLEERLSKLFEAKESAEPTPPDPEEDPLGHLSYQQRQQQAILQEMREQSLASQRTAQQQQQLMQFAQSIQSQEESFRKSAGVSEEAYEAALEHARAEVRGYYKAMGFDDAQADQIAQVEQTQFAVQAVQRGLNPAEARYKLAVSRGFAPPEKEAAQAPSASVASIEDSVRFKRDAVSSSKSLSSVSGSQGRKRITLEDLANAPADLFDKITKDPTLFEEISVKGSLLI